jgi:hypothetical protein
MLPSLSGTKSCPEDGCSMFLQNIVTHQHLHGVTTHKTGTLTMTTTRTSRLVPHSYLSLSVKIIDNKLLQQRTDIKFIEGLEKKEHWYLQNVMAVYEKGMKQTQTSILIRTQRHNRRQLQLQQLIKYSKWKSTWNSQKLLLNDWNIPQEMNMNTGSFKLILVEDLNIKKPRVKMVQKIPLAANN